MKFSIGQVKDWYKAAVGFLKETRSEARKVVWPSKQYVIAATIIVLLILVVAGAYIIFLDSVFAKIFGYLMKSR